MGIKLQTIILSHIPRACNTVEVELPFAIPPVGAVPVALAETSGPGSPGATLPGVKSLIPAPPSGVGATSSMKIICGTYRPSCLFEWEIRRR